ncbi:unnamed protein product [Auanema sp. JU1783]|nr:unnamed protein product [Auanema sp. JU1783]
MDKAAIPSKALGVVGHQEDAFGNISYICAFDRRGRTERILDEEHARQLFPETLKAYKHVVGLNIRHVWDYAYRLPSLTDGFPSRMISTEEYEVDEIVSHRYFNGVLLLCVRWVGFTTCTEQFEEDFTGSQETLLEYKKQNNLL